MLQNISYPSDQKQPQTGGVVLIYFDNWLCPEQLIKQVCKNL